MRCKSEEYDTSLLGGTGYIGQAFAKELSD